MFETRADSTAKLAKERVVSYVGQGQAGQDDHNQGQGQAGGHFQDDLNQGSADLTSCSTSSNVDYLSPVNV